jgi:hypothetical protein
MLKKFLKTKFAKWLERRGVIMTVGKGDDIYLCRIWLTPYTKWGSVGLHFFWRGDGDRSPHDHPWPFATFPINKSYVESVLDEDGYAVLSVVKRWRWHYRPATYTHRVLRPVESGTDNKGGTVHPDGHVSYDHDRITWDGMPMLTLVWMGDKERSWGFWPFVDYVKQGSRTVAARKFVPWRKYVNNAERSL